MNWKITGRFTVTVAFVSVIVIVINILIGVLLIPIISRPKELSPDKFTRNFSDYLLIENNSVSINGTGRQLIDEKSLWIQVLDGDGNEVFNYRKPSEINNHYTPMELINAYKYNSMDQSSIIFVSEKELDGSYYSYLIGFPLTNIRRSFILYDNSMINRNVRFGFYAIILLDGLIALFFGYLFSRKLTKPLVIVVEDIKKLSNGNYEVERKEEGIYKEVYSNLNSLTAKLKKNEEERKELDQMREEWISNISHDIKTPLVSIKGYAEILAGSDYEFTKEEVKEYGNIIEDKANYIKELIDDLNLSTRLKHNALTLNLRNINMVSLVRGIVIDTLNDPKLGSVNIDFFASREVIEKEVDEILIRRVITNLLYNAIIHNDEAVDIKVNVTKKDKVFITIKDFGKGITSKEMKHIFERYYRGTDTGNKHKGSGLGMAIAKDIIIAHKGSVHIRSEVGEGTEIELIL